LIEGNVSLWSDFLTNQHRTIHKWKHYFPAYEAHFSRYINRPMLFLEIGCGSGGSAQMWKRYFGPHAQIVGLDINSDCRAYEEDQIAVRIGSQSDTAFLQTVLDEFGTPDIVLDDGSHIMSDVVEIFRFLYPRTANNGVYLVEDLHTAYWDEFGGGVRREGTFIELCKTLIDELNADWSRDKLPPTDFTRSTLSMHFYDSIVAFERGRHLAKNDVRVSGRQNLIKSILK
jgi:SAM-dependent methyltransferase